MADHVLSANAPGDPRVLYAGIPIVGGEDEWRTYIEAEAAHQRELRAMIAPGGLRAIYLDHLHALADETGAVLTLYRPGPAFIAEWVGTTKRPLLPGLPVQVITPLPLTRMHYLTGLHEFGHVFNPELVGTSHHGVTAEGIYGELMADVWAFEHAKVPVAERDIRDAQSLLYCAALDIGWPGGPLGDIASVLPRRLRRPYSDGLARLDQLRAAEGAER